jgi:hypothetical protein
VGRGLAGEPILNRSSIFFEKLALYAAASLRTVRDLLISGVAQEERTERWVFERRFLWVFENVDVRGGKRNTRIGIARQKAFIVVVFKKHTL